MNAPKDKNVAPACTKSPRIGRASFVAIALCGAPLVSTTPFAEEPGHSAGPEEQTQAPMLSAEDDVRKTGPQRSSKTDSMDMGSMQGGHAAPEPRDPNGYSEGYENSGTPGMEKADQIAVGKLIGDQLEVLNGEGRSGVAWDVYAWYGPDEQKLWVRSEGGIANGVVDDTTSAEALWWRALTPFWGTLLGLRQDFGPGSHTYAALGIEGLAPYWFELEATGYVAIDGRLSARLKGSYDLLITNRLILSPEAETNLYSESNPQRALGAGVGDVELALRLRYEFIRKFAPYLGFDWDRALGSTADRRRANGEPVSDAKVVAGVRLWL